MKQHNLGGARWLGLFSICCPIAGSLPQRFTFEPEEGKFPRTPCKNLYVTASTRFRERAAKSGFKNSHVLWGDALQQVGKGWLMPPTPLDLDGRPFTWRPSQF